MNITPKIGKQRINYCGISGGKDSAATALWLIHESGEPIESLRFTFCDTGNEHALTYAHVRLMSERFAAVGASPVVWLRPERNFLELAMWKKRFPSRKARFCTQFLKVIPTREDVTTLLRSGHEVVVHSGVRSDESSDRAKLPERAFDDMFGCEVNRPLLHWTFEDVINYHKRFGLPLNPLYGYGARRVGCFPCINSTKREIKLISIYFPERIDQIRKQELTSFGKFCSFFSANVMPDRFKSRSHTNRKGVTRKVGTIDDVVRWSKTGKGAIEKSLALFDHADDSTLVCPAGRGMCE